MCNEKKNTGSTIEEAQTNRAALKAAIKETDLTICESLMRLVNRIKGEIKYTPTDGNN